ncbi:hypothetical protein [Shewanella sp.]|nr:hypothetical protein [Shewanella sp.]
MENRDLTILVISVNRDLTILAISVNRDLTIWPSIGIGIELSEIVTSRFW